MAGMLPPPYMPSAGRPSRPAVKQAWGSRPTQHGFLLDNSDLSPAHGGPHAMQPVPMPGQPTHVAVAPRAPLRPVRPAPPPPQPAVHYLQPAIRHAPPPPTPAPTVVQPIINNNVIPGGFLPGRHHVQYLGKPESGRTNNDALMDTGEFKRQIRLGGRTFTIRMTIKRKTSFFRRRRTRHYKLCVLKSNAFFGTRKTGKITMCFHERTQNWEVLCNDIGTEAFTVLQQLKETEHVSGAMLSFLQAAR